MRATLRERGGQEPLCLGLLRYGREGLHTPPRRARRPGDVRRGRRSAPGSAPQARDSPRRHARGSRLLRVRAGHSAAGCATEPRSGRARAGRCESGSKPADRGEVEVEHALEPELAPDALIRDRRVDVAVADRRPRPARARAGSPSSTSSARAATYSSASAHGPTCPPCNTRSRIPSPSSVPPGSRVETTSTPSASSRARRSSACVDFPEPSRPSKVTNIDRILRSSVGCDRAGDRDRGSRVHRLARRRCPRRTRRRGGRHRLARPRHEGQRLRPGRAPRARHPRASRRPLRRGAARGRVPSRRAGGRSRLGRAARRGR